MKMSCKLPFLSSPTGCRPGVWLAWSLRLLLWAVLLSVDTGPSSQGGAHAMKAHIPGDIILGGLFPIHVKGEHAKCGGINKDRGIQRLEAMLFAIDKINADPSLLDGVRLGATILDTCSSDSYALNQSLEFIRASINTADPHNYYCEGGGNLTLKPEASAAISGVIGGSYSEVSLQVANLLRLFRIPQISPASTGTALSDKTRYDFFARTVPPDTFQALAMVAVVQTFNWSYVSLVYSEGQYGESGQEQFTKEARHHNICIAISEKIPHSATDHQYYQVLTRLKHKPNAKGVVLFVRAEDAEGILRAAKEIKRSDDGRNNEFDFYWIASDGWGARKLNEDMQEAAEGAITIELESRRIDEFDSYMLGLTVENNDRNPWFRDYWEAVFECKIRNDSSRTEKDNSSLPTCSQNLNISATKDGYKQENKVQFVVDAVYAMAHAIDDVRKKVCGGRRGICPKLKELDGGLIYQALLNVTFVDLVNSTVRFDEKGDGQAPYIIYNYRRSNVTGEFHYERVGKWLAVDEGLHLNAEEIRFGSKETHDRIIPVSVCSAECGVGEVKKVQAGDHCCWICTRCEPHEYVLNESTCADCGESRWPHTDKKACFDLELQYMKWDSLFAIVPIGIALLGIFLTSGTIAVFIRNNETPIVKASGRELSYMLLSGILICYLMTFVLLLKPTPISCAAQRFGVGLGFSIIYGSLLTKTNRISRIFDSARRSARRPSFISPKSQMIITVLLISVQVAATLIWFLLEPPATRTEYPEGRRNQVILKCKIRDSSFLVSLVYNMFLITTCTVYAIKTRKIPENFNESKFIGFTMYTTCIIWLAFVPIYFGTGNNFQVQITTLCVAISLSAYVALFCLFSPKVYIILFHPDKNVRKLTMNSATYKKAPTSSTTGHAPQNNQPPTTCTTEEKLATTASPSTEAASPSSSNSREWIKGLSEPDSVEDWTAESCAETVKLVPVQTISSQTAGECGAVSAPAKVSPPAALPAPPLPVQAQCSSSGSNKSPPTTSSPPEASASTIKAVDDRGGGDCESLQSL